MFIKIGQGGKINYDMSKWLVEEENELHTIPRCAMGSQAYVISTGETWVMDSKGKWHIMSASQKEPITCDCVDELTIWGEIPEVPTK